MKAHMIEQMSRSKFTNVSLIRRIMHELVCREDENDDSPAFVIPLSLCASLTPHVAKGVGSDYCECENPDNHEDRVIISSKRARK